MLNQLFLWKEIKQLEIKFEYRTYITRIFLSIASAYTSLNYITLFTCLDSLN